MTRAHVVVSGRVQGVGFRYLARDRARSLGLAGWIRNRSDGTVESVVEGPRERVESLLRWFEQGPAGAHVDDVSIGWERKRGEEAFSIR